MTAEQKAERGGKNNGKRLRPHFWIKINRWKNDKKNDIKTSVCKMADMYVHMSTDNVSPYGDESACRKIYRLKSAPAIEILR